MVSFQCNGCGDTLKKPKLDQHAQRCRFAAYTCIDCNVDFQGTDYRAHTSCISEDQKYQKSVYKGPKAKGQPQAPKPVEPTPPAPIPTPTPAPTLPAAVTAAPVATLDSTADADSKKRAREDEGAATKKKAKKDKKKAAGVEEVVEVAETSEAVPMEDVVVDATPATVEAVVPEEETKISKKAAKKLKQKQSKALEESILVVESAIDPSLIPSAPTPLPDIPVLAPLPDILPSTTTTSDLPIAALTNATTVHAFLAPLLPTLLAESRSLAALRTIVVAQAAAAGFSDEKEVEKVLWEGVWIGGPKPKKQVLLNFQRVDRAKGKGKAAKGEAN